MQTLILYTGKLQLSIMFTGGSRVCLIDECSSGVDALARRRLQDILLDERRRSQRTLIFTTHFLDEADLLSDYIAIMSKGSIKTAGTAPEIKAAMGFYRIHLYKTPGHSHTPTVEGVEKKEMFDQTEYIMRSSAQATEALAQLEQQGFKDYQISGPTIEDAFMKISEEMTQPSKSPLEIVPSNSEKDNVVVEEKSSDAGLPDKELQLLTGNRIGFFRQGWVLFRKRATVFRRNALPNLATLFIPIVASGLGTHRLSPNASGQSLICVSNIVFEKFCWCRLFTNRYDNSHVSQIVTTNVFQDQISIGDISSLLTQVNYSIVVGPASKLSPSSLQRFQAALPGKPSLTGGGPGGMPSLASALHTVNSLTEFNTYIQQNYHNVTPGGFYLGDDNSPPTIAYKGNSAISVPFIVQNAMDVLLSNVTIASQYQFFDTPWQADQGRLP